MSAEFKTTWCESFYTCVKKFGPNFQPKDGKYGSATSQVHDSQYIESGSSLQIKPQLKIITDESALENGDWLKLDLQSNITPATPSSTESDVLFSANTYSTTKTITPLTPPFSSSIKSIRGTVVHGDYYLETDPELLLALRNVETSPRETLRDANSRRLYRVFFSLEHLDKEKVFLENFGWRNQHAHRDNKAKEPARACPRCNEEMEMIVLIRQTFLYFLDGLAHAHATSSLAELIHILSLVQSTVHSWRTNSILIGSQRNPKNRPEGSQWLPTELARTTRLIRDRISVCDVISSGRYQSLVIGSQAESKQHAQKKSSDCDSKQIALNRVGFPESEINIKMVELGMLTTMPITKFSVKGVPGSENLFRTDFWGTLRQSLTRARRKSRQRPSILEKYNFNTEKPDKAPTPKVSKTQGFTWKLGNLYRGALRSSRATLSL
ncbi:hypothetical protein V1511DRAFT_495502 [Dipodascopsis uninucleata]